jgi:hypothetical protein
MNLFNIYYALNSALNYIGDLGLIAWYSLQIVLNKTLAIIGQNLEVGIVQLNFKRGVLKEKQLVEEIVKLKCLPLIFENNNFIFNDAPPDQETLMCQDMIMHLSQNHNFNYYYSVHFLNKGNGYLKLAKEHWQYSSSFNAYSKIIDLCITLWSVSSIMTTVCLLYYLHLIRLNLLEELNQEVELLRQESNDIESEEASESEQSYYFVNDDLRTMG